MASPQCEDGFTSIANEIIEALWKVNLSSYETRVLWYLFRKTYGWQKKTDMIALSQFSADIGIDRRHVHRALKNLSSKQVIVTYRGDGSILSYGFQKDYEKWVLSPIGVTVPKQVTRVSPNQATKLSPIQAPTKERKKEEKEIRVEIPSWISLECFESFREMRKKIKKPMTKRAEQLVIKELGKLKEQGFNPNDVLDQSTRNDWQDVYPIKEKGNGNKKGDSAITRGLAAFLASEDGPERD